MRIFRKNVKIKVNRQNQPKEESFSSKVCPDSLSAVAPLERLDAFAFGEHARCAGESERRAIFALLKALNEWSNQWPELQENATCLTNPLPDDLSPIYFADSFVRLEPGITVFYPKW